MPQLLVDNLRRLSSGILIFAFLADCLLPPQAIAQNRVEAVLPVVVSPLFTPPLIKGLSLYPENPLKFDFMSMLVNLI